MKQLRRIRRQKKTKKKAGFWRSAYGYIQDKRLEQKDKIDAVRKEREALRIQEKREQYEINERHLREAKERAKYYNMKKA